MLIWLNVLHEQYQEQVLNEKNRNLDAFLRLILSVLPVNKIFHDPYFADFQCHQKEMIKVIL